MKQRIREHLKRHFSLYVIITNALCAIAVAAFAILGVFSSLLSVPVLIANATIFGVIYAIGKFGNEQLEDIPKVYEFENGCRHV